MKKLALVLATTLVAFSETKADISTGPYIGLLGGYGATSGKSSGQEAQNTPAIPPFPAVPAGTVVPGTTSIGGMAGSFGIYGGYGLVVSSLYYGGELGYTYENTKITDTIQAGDGSSQQLKRNGYFSAALRGGYLFIPRFMGYISLSVRWGNWRLNDSLNFGFTSTQPAKGSKNSFTFAPGVGMEFAVHKNVYLRGEYAYEFGPSIRATNSNLPNGFSNIGTIRSHSTRVGLSYKFY